MKNVFELTAHDSNTGAFVAKQFYSNRKAAHGSFTELKEHLIEKYNLDPTDIKKWTFSDGGDHQTDILAGRFNVTLVIWNVSKETSTFIKD
jgi:hypothetical protein